MFVSTRFQGSIKRTLTPDCFGIKSTSSGGMCEFGGRIRREYEMPGQGAQIPKNREQGLTSNQQLLQEATNRIEGKQLHRR